MIKSIYLDDVLNVQSFKKLISRAKRKLLPFADQYQAIAFTGNSGAMFGPMLAAVTGKEMILVRKSIDDSHSSLMVEGYLDDEDHLRYIIADDLVSSGKTIAKISLKIEGICERFDHYKPECVGIVLYRTSDKECVNMMDLFKRSVGAVDNASFFAIGLQKSSS